MSAKRGDGPPAGIVLSCYLLTGVTVALAFFPVPTVLVVFGAASVIASAFLLANYGPHANAIGCLLLVAVLAFLHFQQADRNPHREPLIRLSR